MQCDLHEVTLEKYPKVSAVTKCSHMGNFEHPKNGTCNTSAVWAALGAGLLPGPIHGVGYGP